MSKRYSGEGNWNYGKKGKLSQNFGLKRNEETKLKMSETKKGAKNPNVGKFEILAPDGKFFYVNAGIPNFIEEHPEYKVKKWILYQANQLGNYKGWKIIKLN